MDLTGVDYRTFGPVKSCSIKFGHGLMDSSLFLAGLGLLGLKGLKGLWTRTQG